MGLDQDLKDEKDGTYYDVVNVYMNFCLFSLIRNKTSLCKECAQHIFLDHHLCQQSRHFVLCFSSCKYLRQLRLVLKIPELAHTLSAFIPASRLLVRQIM